MSGDGEMDLWDAKQRLMALSRKAKRGETIAVYEDGEAIVMVIEAINTATHCDSCGGNGKRWYALYGFGTCDTCKGSGRR